MNKSPTDKSHSKVKHFFSKNWISLATLLISLFALFVSIQSNLISKESNQIAIEAANANLRLITDIKPDDMLLINIFGCYSQVAAKYEIVRYITDSATLTNMGGSGTAL